MKVSPSRAPLLCLGMLVLTACGAAGKNQGPPPMPPPEVGVIRAEPQNVPLTRDLVGRLSAFRSADVRARISGVLLKRSYDEGADVKQGQLLFQIDPAPLKASLDAALASLAQAQATYTNSKVSAQRVRELAPKGYVSKADLDNALASERTAAAAMQQARANVQSARISLGYASVTSPIDGRAGQQQVTEGALVGQGDATLLTTVEQIDRLYVNFTLSASEYNQLRQAQSSGGVTLSDPAQTRVKVALPDGTPFPQQGTLDFSGTVVNQSTGAISLRARLPNPGQRLLPGQYVTLTASLGQQHDVFLVPQQAIQRDTASAYALVVGADGKVLRKNVSAAQTSGNSWVITHGLSAGDQVIVSGLQQVHEGAPAKATPWQPDSGAAAKGTAMASTGPGAQASAGKQ